MNNVAVDNVPLPHLRTDWDAHRIFAMSCWQEISTKAAVSSQAVSGARTIRDCIGRLVGISRDGRSGLFDGLKDPPIVGLLHGQPRPSDCLSAAAVAPPRRLAAGWGWSSRSTPVGMAHPREMKLMTYLPPPPPPPPAAALVIVQNISPSQYCGSFGLTPQNSISGGCYVPGGPGPDAPPVRLQRDWTAPSGVRAVPWCDPYCPTPRPPRWTPAAP